MAARDVSEFQGAGEPAGRRGRHGDVAPLLDARVPGGAHASERRHPLASETRRAPAALPEATRDTATGEALQAIMDLDLDELIAIQPPRGFGRD